MKMYFKYFRVLSNVRSIYYHEDANPTGKACKFTLFHSSSTTLCICIQELCGCLKVDDLICESWLETELMEVAPDKYPPVQYDADIMKSLNFDWKFEKARERKGLKESTSCLESFFSLIVMLFNPKS